MDKNSQKHDGWRDGKNGAVYGVVLKIGQNVHFIFMVLRFLWVFNGAFQQMGKFILIENKFIFLLQQFL